MPRYEPLKPIVWPQDQLAAPRGGGLMPVVEHANGAIIGQESFTLGTEFIITTALAAGTQTVAIIPTDQDGDFWCDQIYALGYLIEDNTQLLVGTLQIEDIRSGRQLCYPEPVPLQMFAGAAPSEDTGFLAAASPFPSGFRPVGNLSQPYCFTRAGGIRLTLTNTYALPGAQTIRVNIALGGWKEYTYAAR
jgi:hypothetical protein